MAKISKPIRKRTTKGTPPPPEAASENLTRTTDQTLRPLNFKVPADFRKQYKLYAMEHDISMVELLKKSFEHYRNR